MTFRLTKIQQKAWELISGPAKHVLLVGGSRSGKTFISIRAVILRALLADGSRHVILRFRFSHVKNTVILDTFPKVMSLCFPGIRYHLDRSDWYATFDNGSQIWFGGLDDDTRSEKVLGSEYATLFLNECSQISSSARSIALTRLSQQCFVEKTGNNLRVKAIYDCNPPSTAHWTYKMFQKKVQPETNMPLTNPLNYESIFMNPFDNLENLPEDYITEMESLPAAMKRRFLEGRYSDISTGTLWTVEMIEATRDVMTPLPEMRRITVGVDPSGSADTNNERNDATGIMVCGKGSDNIGYVLEDCTIKAGPATWGVAAIEAYHRHRADKIVAEKNYGGEMVRHVIHSIDPYVKCDLVTATRGKCVRAQPISALTEQKKIRFTNHFPALEDELCAMSEDGYTEKGSPNRADAFVWAMSDLFPVGERSNLATWIQLGTPYV